MVDVATAEHHGVCPVCEGYGGGGEREDECERIGSGCIGSCPNCWCPGCHDGNAPGLDAVEPEERMGSWAAYVALNSNPAEEPS